MFFYKLFLFNIGKLICYYYNYYNYQFTYIFFLFINYQTKISDSEEYSDYQYSYNSYNDEESTENDDDIEIQQEESKRVAFDNNVPIQLQIGENAQIKINPLQNKAFNIQFLINEHSDEKIVELLIKNGSCTIKANDLVGITEYQEQQKPKQTKQQQSLSLQDLYDQIYQKVK